MTRKEACRHLSLAYTASIGGTVLIQVSFFVATHLEPTRPGLENLPCGMIAVAGLLTALLCSVSIRTIIKAETTMLIRLMLQTFWQA